MVYYLFMGRRARRSGKELPMARTDVHAPTHLITEDYEYWGSYDGGEVAEYDPISGKFSETRKVRIYRFIKEHGLKFAATHGHNGDQCDHCGAHLRYVALMLHKPTNTILHVGENCLANRFEQATAAFHAMRKAAELDREKMRIKTAREEYFAANPDIRIAYDRFISYSKNGGLTGTEFEDSFLQDLMRKLRDYGSLSEKQTPWVEKCISRWVDRKLAEKEREDEKATIADVEEGTYEFTGTIVSVKEHFSDFGSSWKMTVKAEDGRVYWGTIPVQLFDIDITNKDLKEETVTVTIKAAVTRSEKDRTFGFFKRPRLVSVTDAEGTIESKR